MNNQLISGASGVRLRSRRGFTLIEMTMALMVMSILILASGGILIFLARGQNEARDDNDVQNRLELVREMIVADFRPGRAILTPNTAGGTGTSVEVETLDYNPATGNTTVRRYRWTFASNTITRYVATETATPGTFSAETQTISQSNIATFSVTRFNDGDGLLSNDRRLDFTLTATQGTQSASIAFTVMLRNVG